MTWETEDSETLEGILLLADRHIGNDQIAKRLGVSSCAVAQWRHRGRVPTKYIAELIEMLRSTIPVTASMLCPLGKHLAVWHDKRAKRAQRVHQQKGYDAR